MGTIYFSCDGTPVKKPKKSPPRRRAVSGINLNRKGAGGVFCIMFGYVSTSDNYHSTADGQITWADHPRGVR